MSYRSASLSLLFLLPFLHSVVARSQSAPASAPPGLAPDPDRHTLPIGTVLPVQIPGNLPMRVGQPIRAELIYPVYDANTLVLPAHTQLIGSVTDLCSNRSRRVHASLGGDFTPFHIPVVRFTQIVLADGSTLPFSSDPATDGAPIYRAVAPPPSKGGFLRQQLNIGAGMLRDDLAYFISPGKGDRLKQFIYGRLPYHPHRIARGPAWPMRPPP